MKTNKIIVIFLCVILVLIVYKLYKNDNDNDNDNDRYEYVEHFGILDKIKKKNRKKNNNSNNSNNNSNSNKKDGFEDTKISKYHNSIRALKSEKNDMTFEDVLKAGEAIDPNVFTIEHMKNELLKYSRSFSKEKFKNNSQNTAESFEKFGLYKEKFFELFR
jgi:hypothetical protein